MYKRQTPVAVTTHRPTPRCITISALPLSRNVSVVGSTTESAKHPNGVIVRDTLTLQSTREIKDVTMKCSIDIPSNISHHIMDQIPIMTVDHPRTPIMPLQKKLNFAFLDRANPSASRLPGPERRVPSIAAAAAILASSGTFTYPEACPKPTGKLLTMPCLPEP